MKKILIIYTGFLLFVIPSLILAKDNSNSDHLFQEARNLAFAKRRDEAKKICLSILNEKPKYHEVRVFLARIYAWDKEFDLARDELKKVLKDKSDHKEAINALIDVELWSDNSKEALNYCNEGLSYYPDFEDFLLKKDRAIEKIEYDDMVNKVSLDWTYDSFDKTFSPWQLASLELSRRTKIGSVIGRINYARRFKKDGFQFELDSYPRITKDMYAYLNAGFSSSDIFPEFRCGTSLYHKLPKSSEGEIGVRYLKFSSSDVTIFTSSLSKYLGNYWFSFRPFITPKSSGSSLSGSIIIRRYLSDAQNHLTLTLKAGFSSDETDKDLELYHLKSQKVKLDLQKKVSKKWTLKSSVAYENEEYRQGSFRDKYSFGIGTGIIF